jgi:hypothetical protein
MTTAHDNATVLPGNVMPFCTTIAIGIPSVVYRMCSIVPILRLTFEVAVIELRGIQITPFTVGMSVGQ